MRHRLTSPSRIAVAAITTVALAVALAACGSSSSSSSSASASGGRATNVAFTSCLKSHGVTLPKGRPGGGPGRRPGGGGGFPFGGGGGRSGGAGESGGTRSSKFRSAIQACRKDLPDGGRFSRRRGGAGRFSAATLRMFSDCVKKHGYSLPAPNTSGKGPVFPRKIETNQTFEKAARACRSDLRPSGAPPASGSAG